MIYVLLLGGAAALLVGPMLARRAAPSLGPEPAPPPHLAPTYQSAIADLAHVRLRLLQTESLAEAEKKAIDTLTLALVAGSDKP
jgi:hypothetical protein